MTVYVFRSQARSEIHGLTREQNGQNLPESYAPWDFQKAINLDQYPENLIAEKKSVIEDSLADKGFHITRTRFLIRESVEPRNA